MSVSCDGLLTPNLSLNKCGIAPNAPSTSPTITITTKVTIARQKEKRREEMRWGEEKDEREKCIVYLDLCSINTRIEAIAYLSERFDLWNLTSVVLPMFSQTIAPNTQFIIYHI